jgi:hypothetical protein
MSADPQPQQVHLPLVYGGGADTDVLLANHFSLSNLQDEFILTVGQIAPPPLVGSKEEQVEQAEKLGGVPVRVIGRYTFSRTRAEELMHLIERQLKAYDAKKGDAK